MPAVRGWKKILIVVVQVLTGSLMAVTMGVIAGSASRSMGFSASVVLAIGVCVAVAAVDMVYKRTGRPRPLALHRQVPLGWARRHGPWKGAARYAFRMGLGPATILVSWTWWGAFVLCAVSGVTAAAMGGLVFVVVRFVGSALSTAGVDNGTSMVLRARRLDAVAPSVDRGVVVAPIAAAALCVIALVVS